MTVVSYFAATHAGDYKAWVGWFGVAFFGYVIVVIVKQLFTKTAIVTINDEGISAVRISQRPIPWSQIDSVSIGKVRGTRFLCVWLLDEESYLRSLSTAKAALARANHALGFPAITISFQGLAPGIDEAYAFIQTYVQKRSVA